MLAVLNNFAWAVTRTSSTRIILTRCGGNNNTLHCVNDLLHCVLIAHVDDVLVTGPRKIVQDSRHALNAKFDIKWNTDKRPPRGIGIKQQTPNAKKWISATAYVQGKDPGKGRDKTKQFTARISWKTVNLLLSCIALAELA